MKIPKTSNKDLWNSAEPLPEGMILYIIIVKKEPEDANDGLPFNLTPYGQLYDFLVEKSRGEYKDNLCYLETIKDKLSALVGINH
jgi:hypothetical protein